MSFKSQEYECDIHGRFEATVPREDDEKPQPCPECGEPSEWRISGPLGRMAMGGLSFERGKGDGPRHHRDLDTRAMADGQSVSAFRKARRKMWQAERRAAIRQSLA